MRVLGALSPSVLAAHWPISSPALKLSVAKVASAALIGSSGVSSAITRMPASRAFSMVGTIALVSLGVIRMPLAPAAIRLSIAATWPSLSPSTLPAKARSSTPSSLALASAPSFILTKNGLMSVLVIRPTMMSSADDGAGEATSETGRAEGEVLISERNLMSSLWSSSSKCRGAPGQALIAVLVSDRWQQRDANNPADRLLSHPCSFQTNVLNMESIIKSRGFSY